VVLEQADNERRAMAVLAALMAYWGYLDAANGAAAPFLAAEFGLDDGGIVRAFGWTSIGALGTYVLARAADRVGRRRILLATLLGLAPLALTTALAPGLWSFVAVQVGVQALKGVLLTVVPVMVAEVLPTASRARGQGLIGLTGALGSGLALIAVASGEGVPGTWRWAWGLAALGIAALPLARRALPESGHFERAAAAGETARARAGDLLGARFRRRTLGVLAVATLFAFALSVTQSWLIYHPVRHLGVAPMLATAAVIGGGAFGLAGFPLGSRLSERWGRRPTFGTASALYLAANFAFYRVPADFPPSPALALGAAFAGMSLLSSAAAVPLRATLTELLPTALRATLSGWVGVAMAAAVVVGYFATAALAEALGDLATAVVCLSLAMASAGLVFVVVLPETRGRELVASLDEPL
jgi:MFS family permease